MDLGQTVTDAREAGAVPRIHGNGFIQLDLDDKTRLNFWGHPEIPRQLSPSPVHSHRFDFESRVLKGRLVNVIYRFFANAEKATHAEFKPYPAIGHDTVLLPTGIAGYILPHRTNCIMAVNPKPDANTSYGMFADEFHETFALEPAVTLMRKGEIRKDVSARVLVPIGKAPSNDWTREYNGDGTFLWRLIEEIIA